ncbi:MAG: hypothetical protein KC561_21645, partial [Myxococcales bacterium]|nr:hypothetical protein [Myxococcales bacterium]
FDAFLRFKEHLERGVTSKADLASLDLEALSQIKESERSDAEDLLKQRVKASVEDPRVIDALVQIGTESAWTVIDEAANNAPPITRLRALRRLSAAGRRQDILGDVASIARNHDASMAAEEYLSALLDLASDEADDVMVDLLDKTTNRSVRTMVVTALFRRFDLDKYEEVATGPVWHLRMGLTAPFPSVRSQALDELRELIDKRRAGKTDKELGL